MIAMKGLAGASLVLALMVAPGLSSAKPDFGKPDFGKPDFGKPDFGKPDFGEQTEQMLRGQSNRLFGFNNPLEASATIDDVVPRAEATAQERQLLAGHLRAEYVARNVAYRADMIAFWPDDLHYTHLIVCIEGGRADPDVGPVAGLDGQNPSVQRVNVHTGQVETILFGMSRCDGIRTTQWGTVLATEETDDGHAYEIIDPLNITGHWIADRATGDIRDAVGSSTASTNVAQRDALATQAWEGLDTLDSGVVIGGDELRPEQDTDGGAVFRFVPSAFYDCVGSPVRPGQLCDNTITDLDQSPLVAGQNYALFTVCSGTNDDGQGCEYGDEGRWVKVGAATARADANANGATGYCRPEDLHIDRTYGLFAGADGIRWCWNNTCGGSDGEALCSFESTEATNAAQEQSLDIGGTVGAINFLSLDGTELAKVDVQRFVENDREMKSHDNLEIQPFSGNTYIVEDYNTINDGGTGGDIWACLPDGTDRDERTDGCVRMLSIADVDAEPTGFIFDGTGKVAFYNLQHGSQDESLRDLASNPACDDGACNGYTDDLIRITRFRAPREY
jgi:hypothetical protein